MAKKPKKPKLSFPVCWYNSKVFKLVQGAVAFSIASSARSCFHINLEQFNGAAVFKCNHEFSSTYSWEVFNPAMHCNTNTSAPLNFTIFLHSLFSEYFLAHCRPSADLALSTGPHLEVPGPCLLLLLGGSGDGLRPTGTTNELCTAYNKL